MSHPILRLVEQSDMPKLGSFDLARAFPAHVSDVAKSARDYFSAWIPQTTIQLDFHNIWGPSDLIRQNYEFVPGCCLLPLGFIVFATDGSGDVFGVDTRSGRAHHFLHELFGDDGIHIRDSEGGWRKARPSRENLTECSDVSWDSIAEFLTFLADGYDEIKNEK
jgi:hypothetical protein